MTMTARAFVRKLRGTRRSSAFEREMDAELRHHIELTIALHIRRGLDPDAAKAAAYREFGSVAGVKDACRDSWGMRALDALGQDLRFGLRDLAKHRSYTLIVLVTLALGIGANTAIFSVVHAVLLRPLPYGNGDRLVEVRQEAPGAGIADLNLSVKDMADYKAQTSSLDALVEYHQMNFNLLGRDVVSRVTTGVVSADFFDVFGVAPLLGRTFRPDDDVKGAPAVLVLSYEYWQRMFGGDPSVVGRTFDMNDKVHTVVGVLPPVPLYPQDSDVYMPVAACPFRSSAAMTEGRAHRMVSGVGRLKAGIGVDRARRDLAVVADRLAATHPKDYPRDAGFTATALPLREELTRRARPTLLLLQAVTGFVLVLVCANVANLTLARLMGRHRELSLRAALGAGRGRIARQLMTEGTILALGGGVLGLGVAYLTRGLLVGFTARLTPRATEIGIDPLVLVFALAVSVLTGILFSAVPAFSQRRELPGALKAAQRTLTGRDGHARSLLVVTQVAISFVLLIGAGLMVRSFINLQQVDAGFRSDHVLTLQIDLDWIMYDTLEKQRAFFTTLLDKVQAEPGVRSAAVTQTFPLSESGPLNANLLVEGHPPAAGQPARQVDFHVASPAYFETIGMSLVRGRVFTNSDTADTPPVAIVNASMARHRFGDQDAVGRRVSLDGGATWMTIVGLVNDVKQYSLDAMPSDELYRPFSQRPIGSTVLVRTAGDPLSHMRDIQADIQSVDPRQPVSRIQTLEEVRSSSLASPRLTMMLVTAFAVLALAITAAGIGGVVSFSVNQRTTEIGVRLALGAQRSAVVGMIARQGLTPVAAGLAIGVFGAYALTRLVASLLFEVQPSDASTFTVVFLLLASVAALSCLAPTRRAASLNPIEALRGD
ncbi:MAG TPA: ABC transporter permease [Vicinamibacterales bacterium]|jgi:predicted permease|nr:ABC transporter permease [Vicinamibacterales bacterium]